MIGIGIGLSLTFGAGGGVHPPLNFAFIRTVPGTRMRNPPNIYVIAPALSGQGVSA